jgi:hypothetical protein
MPSTVFEGLLLSKPCMARVVAHAARLAPAALTESSAHHPLASQMPYGKHDPCHVTI